ncbi:hypothetical protein [Endozoicomonas arenosclerae]|uniref:hypothetical protein n=1 Tax=Endozoicomonas arenosclerae TaxID=1633495 RepID=UPI000780EB29|nr:hypothetical protein [Endozoicomonas arenosclerae]
MSSTSGHQLCVENFSGVSILGSGYSGNTAAVNDGTRPFIGFDGKSGLWLRINGVKFDASL